MRPTTHLEPRPWLPPPALSAERIEPILARLVAEWSDCWFTDARAGIGQAPAADLSALEPESMRCCPPLLAAAAGPAARVAIAAAMLGTNLPGLPLARDKSVIDALAIDCVDDLLKRIWSLARDGAPPEPGDGGIECSAVPWAVSVGKRRAVIRLVIAQEAAIGVIKRALPRSAPPNVEPIGRGLLRQEVALAADLGRARVGLLELEGLSAGDVLVLDSSAESPLGLLLNGEHAPLSALLEEKDGGAMLTLQSTELSNG
jgi:hypothetical protein